MDSYDDFQLFPSPVDASPEIQRSKFKRLKKARAPSTDDDDVFDFPKVDFSKLEALDDYSNELVSSQDTDEDETRSGSDLDEKGGESSEELEGSRTLEEDSANLTENSGKDVVIADEQCKEVKRSLNFGEDDDRSRQIGQDLESSDVLKDLDLEKLGIQQDVEGNGDLKEDDKWKMKKKRSKRGKGGEVKSKELASNKRREAKERKALLQQLHADTQRLLRESKDATFKPIPVVHKPISSILEKIRKRKLEVSKKTMMLSSTSSIDKISASREIMMEVEAKSTYPEEQRVDKLEIELEGKADPPSKDTGRTTDTSNTVEISASPITRSSEIAPDEMALDERPNAVFRAPVDDTQDLFDDSEPKDEMLDNRASSPLEEVMAPSLVALNLKFDSALPDESSSDEEDNDKENIKPYTKEGGDGSSSPKGDPVKAFVDDEAEEEDDSDNDLLRFGDNEEEDIDDAADLHDMIATDYEEKLNDTEKRNELHQKWLEQQDAAGTENLLQRLKCGVEQQETMLVDDELESNECEEELNNVTDMDAVPKSTARLNSKKAKQMIMQMFVDKDDVFLSDEDEETEKRLVKQRMLYNSELTTEVSPIEDENSSEIFGLIKKLNTAPDNKRKPKASSFFDTVLGDQKKKSSLKSSFLGRVKNNLPSSHKQNSTILRSFIFGRDDSNSRSSLSMSEDSSDMTVKENCQVKSSTEFSNFQAKLSSQGRSAAAGTSAAAPLFELLRRSSAPSNVCSRDVLLDLPKPLLADLRVTKRSMKVEVKR